MKNDKSKNIIIALLVVIIIILVVLVVLFATDTISLNSKINDNNNELSNENIVDGDNAYTNDDIDNDEQVVSRDDILAKLKSTLTNEAWIKEHLYSKEDCFGQKVEVTTQKLTFTMLSDEKNNPIVIVLNDTSENFIKVIYKVYYENGEILAKNITDSVAHPSHVGFSVDKSQGLVIETYAHMGYYIFKAYDIKNDEIKIYDEYNCTTGNCDYEYKGEKNYSSSDISIELNSENVNNYIK